MGGVLRDQDADRALVEVQFSAHDFRQARDGAVSDLGNWKRYRTVLVLRRNKGVTSNVSQSLISAHCPSCGAPETDLTSHACEFCGEVLNQGRFSWVLERSFPSPSAEARRWQQRLAEPTATRQAARVGITAGPVTGISGELIPMDGLEWIVKVMAADGEIHEKEKSQLLDFAQRNAIPPQAVEAMLSDQALADLEVPDPPDSDTTRRWLGDMVDMALVDGTISRDEERILVQVGRNSGLAPSDVRRVISKRRALARKRLRQQRGSS